MKHDPKIHSHLFPASVKPVREGVYYRTSEETTEGFSLFSRGVWHYGEDTPHQAAGWSKFGHQSYVQSFGFTWFGMKEPA